MDSVIQRLRRQAATGGPESQAAYLRARIKTGELDRGRIEVAAYLGNTTSRRAVGFPDWLPYVEEWGRGSWRYLDVRNGDIRRLVRGLYRFGQDISLRAAVAAARSVMAKWWSIPGQTMARWHDAAKAIHGAERWLVEPTSEQLEAWRVANVRAGIGVRDDINWLPYAVRGGKARESDAECIKAAANLTSEKDVRQTIQDELVSWALGKKDPIVSRVAEQS